LHEPERRGRGGKRERKRRITVRRKQKRKKKEKEEKSKRLKGPASLLAVNDDPERSLLRVVRHGGSGVNSERRPAHQDQVRRRSVGLDGVEEHRGWRRRREPVIAMKGVRGEEEGG